MIKHTYVRPKMVEQELESVKVSGEENSSKQSPDGMGKVGESREYLTRDEVAEVVETILTTQAKLDREKDERWERETREKSGQAEVLSTPRYPSIHSGAWMR